MSLDVGTVVLVVVGFVVVVVGFVVVVVGFVVVVVVVTSDETTILIAPSTKLIAALFSDVTKEIPTLYQISVAVMKNNTKIVMR